MTQVNISYICSNSGQRHEQLLVVMLSTYPQASLRWRESIFHQSPSPAIRPVYLHDERDPVPKSSGYPPHTSRREGPLMVVPVEALNVLNTS
jgi:hypothetical protein